MTKHNFKSNIAWIKKNQTEDGSIVWDLNGKCDPWDHLECLLALAIFEEEAHFKKGMNWFFANLDDNHLIQSEFKNGKVHKDYYEHHHAIYAAVPLLQYLHMGLDKKYVKEKLNEVAKITEATLAARDQFGCFYWAQDINGMCDNSLITATSSIYLSLKCAIKIFEKFGINTTELKTELKSIRACFHENSERFDRDQVDRSRFSMDYYYPFLSGLDQDKESFIKGLSLFYVDGLGIKCVIEEPWVTFAESSELIIALCRFGEFDLARKIFMEIDEFKDQDGVLPTGYQYAEKIFWPDERSSWTNAAYVIAADCLFDLTNKEKAILS